MYRRLGGNKRSRAGGHQSFFKYPRAISLDGVVSVFDEKSTVSLTRTDFIDLDFHTLEADVNHPQWLPRQRASDLTQMSPVPHLIRDSLCD